MRGKIASGLGQGQYFISRESSRQFMEKLGYGPLPRHPEHAAGRALPGCIRQRFGSRLRTQWGQWLSSGQARRVWLAKARRRAFSSGTRLIYLGLGSPLYLPDLSWHIGKPHGSASRCQEGVFNPEHPFVRIDHLGLYGDGHVAIQLMIQGTQHRILIQL